MNAKEQLIVVGLVALLALGLAPGSAFAQDGVLSARIAELEKRINELETAKTAEKPAVGSEAKLAVYGNSDIKAFLTPPVAAEPTPDRVPGPRWGGPGDWLEEGFILYSTDGRHQLRITGQIQTDVRVYPRHSDFTDNDTFLVRRARLGIEATVFDAFEFRLLPDWGNGKSVVQDAYINVHYIDEFQIQGGKFKEPVSFEQLIQDRFVPTMERSLVDQIVPARDVGFMVHGQYLFNGRLDYAIGVFNGEPNADTDTNKTKDVAARIAWRPLALDALPEFVRPLQIGVSGSAGKEQEPLDFNGSTPQGTLRTPANIPWLNFNSTVRADGVRTRVTPEVSYLYGPCGFAAQYIRMDQDMRSGVPTTVVSKGKVVAVLDDPIQNIRFGGYYFLATYLLTGEQRLDYSAPVEPLRPFQFSRPFINPGAWELVARVSHLQVDPSIFQPDPRYNLARALGNSDAATELTLGFNWYLNALVRMQFNWEHAWYQQPLLLGPNAFFRQTDAVLVRFQIIF
jgi:phosphate-selective porin OprO/OprP